MCSEALGARACVCERERSPDPDRGSRKRDVRAPAREREKEIEREAGIDADIERGNLGASSPISILSDSRARARTWACERAGVVLYADGLPSSLDPKTGHSTLLPGFRQTEGKRERKLHASAGIDSTIPEESFVFEKFLRTVYFAVRMTKL